MDTKLADYIQQRDAILERVRRILIDNLDVRRDPDEIDPDTPLFGSGLGLDSVDAVELLVSVEVEFGIQVPDDPRVGGALRTVNTLVDLVIASEASSHGA
jgi:acyl carrier protein